MRGDRVEIVVTAQQHELRIGVEAADEVCFRFRHSIYGSLVEEVFAPTANGLRQRQLRYEEPRLADYYGHEHSERSGDWWVVAGNGVLHASLLFRVSNDSEMELRIGERSVRLSSLAGAGRAICVKVEQ